MTGGTAVIGWLIAISAVLTCALFALVAISKIRRDRAESRSALLRAAIRQAWIAGDAAGFDHALHTVGEGGLRGQADLLASLRQCESQDPSAERSEVARAAVARSGLEALLLAQVGSPEPARRGMAARLGSLDATRLPTAVLAALIRDGDPTVRLAAAGALEEHASDTAATALIGAMEDGLLDAPRAVERLAHPWAVATLCARATDPDPAMRRNIADALGIAGVQEGIATLIAMTAPTEGEEVRIAAYRGLRRCAPIATADQRPDIRQRARSAMSDGNPAVRANALSTLAEVGELEDLELFTRATGDQDWFVRRAAARALIQSGPPGIARLREIEHGTDSYAAERARAELALAEHGSISGRGPA